MKERAITALSLVVLIVLGIFSLLTALYGQSGAWKFPLAFYPLVVILVGVAFLRQSGLTMALVGLVVTIVFAVSQFSTSLEVALGASAYGFIKSFGISISVAATMLMIFLMRETGALSIVSKVIKQQVVGNEIQALYVGIGFGSFLTSLGVVTPALFPPFLIAMGFPPTSAIAIAVLGYDPTTSFSLLSIPITLPAQQAISIIGSPINVLEFAFKIALFLPMISTGFAFAILWVVGGKKSMRRGALPALICGLALALACLGVVSLDYLTGIEYIPLRIVGVIAGATAMISLYVYQKLRPPTAKTEKSADYPKRREIFRALSPWIILVTLAVVVSIPQIDTWLRNLPGSLEQFTVFANQSVDLDFLSQIYTWIFLAILLSLAIIKPTKKQAKAAFGTWLKRFVGPFMAYSLYFSIAYVMAFSAREIVNGALTSTSLFTTQNMNVILGSTLASVFGRGYIFVAAALGLFGAIVGGSETSSNVLFMKIQKTAADDIGLSSSGFMTIYGSHAVAGGVASAVTPAKINNAVVTIGESKAIESIIMRKHLVVAILLTIATGILTGILVSLGV